MKIITTAEALTAALKLGFTPDRKSTIPILSYVLVSASQITATNLDNFTTVPFDAKGTGEVLLPYRQTLEVLNKEKGPLEIEFDVKQKVKKGEPEPHKQVSLTVNGSTFKFDAMSRANFPKMPDLAKAELTIDGKEFKTALTRTLFAISHVESRYTLNGALLTTAEGMLRVVATDGHRLSLVEIPMKVKDGIKMLIPLSTLEYLKTRLGDTVEIGSDALGYLTIITNGITLVSRKLNGQFPNWEAVMPRETPIKGKIAGTATILPSLVRVAKCSDDRSGCVKFTFGNVATVISAASSDRGEAQATIPIAIDSKEQISVGLNSEFVIDFLKAIGDVPFEIGIRDPQSAVQFSLDNFKHILMPMRL